jgi:hypothetical protein
VTRVRVRGPDGALGTRVQCGRIVHGARLVNALHLSYCVNSCVVMHRAHAYTIGHTQMASFSLSSLHIQAGYTLPNAQNY